MAGNLLSPRWTLPADSIRHPWVVHAARLARDRHYRQRHQRLLIGGHHVVREYLQRGGVVSTLACTSHYQHRPDAVRPDEGTALKLSSTCIEYITREAAPEGILCEIPAPRNDGIARTMGEERVVVLWSVRYPGNLGTLIRSAAGFGWRILLAGHCADHLSYEAIRCSKGASLHVPIQVARTERLAEILRDHTVLHTGKPVSHPTMPSLDPSTKIALVVGNETHGLDGFPLLEGSMACWIPTLVDSLNVAVAGSILMSRFSKMS